MSAIERLQRDVPGTFAISVVFYEPADAEGSWRETDLWARAGKLVDAKVIADPLGLLTAKAGAVVQPSRFTCRVPCFAQLKQALLILPQLKIRINPTIQ